MGDEATAGARRAALAPYRIDDALLDRAAPGRDRAALPARAPGRGDHRRGALRRRASGSGTRPRTAGTRRRRCSSGSCREPAASSYPEPDVHPSRPGPPRARRRARPAHRLPRLRRRRASRDWTATSSSSATRSRATGSARSSRSASARTPRRARSRCSSRAPTGSRRSPTIRARRGRCCRTSASSRSRPSRSTTRCTRIGHLEGFALEPIVPAVEQWRYRNKLEYSFGTSDAGALVCGFHAPGSWERDRRAWTTACSPPSAATRRARRRSRGAARRGSPAYDRRTPGGRAAQPRRARGAPDRRAAGPPGHLARASSTWTASPRPSARQRHVDARGRRRRDDRGRRVRGAPRDARRSTRS